MCRCYSHYDRCSKYLWHPSLWENMHMCMRERCEHKLCASECTSKRVNQRKTHGYDIVCQTKKVMCGVNTHFWEEITRCKQLKPSYSLYWIQMFNQGKPSTPGYISQPVTALSLRHLQKHAWHVHNIRDLSGPSFMSDIFRPILAKRIRVVLSYVSIAKYIPHSHEHSTYLCCVILCHRMDKETVAPPPPREAEEKTVSPPKKRARVESTTVSSDEPKRIRTRPTKKRRGKK